MTIVGWSRVEVEELNTQLSMMAPDQQTVPIFRVGEEVAEYKAG